MNVRHCGIALVFLAVAAWADDSAVVGVGGAVRPMKAHPTIRMVSERVEIWLPDGKVRAEFVFRNEGPATTVEMGFPDGGGGDVGSHKGMGFRKFASTVDGKPVGVKLMAEPKAEGYQNWWVKKVTFAKGQTRRVACDYVSPLGKVSDGSRFYGYRLDTGANWKGTIGSAEIVVHLKGADFWVLGHLFPKPANQTSSEIRWVRRDFEPSTSHGPWSQIYISWTP